MLDFNHHSPVFQVFLSLVVKYPITSKNLLNTKAPSQLITPTEMISLPHPSLSKLASLRHAEPRPQGCEAERHQLLASCSPPRQSTGRLRAPRWQLLSWTEGLTRDLSEGAARADCTARSPGHQHQQNTPCSLTTPTLNRSQETSTWFPSTCTSHHRKLSASEKYFSNLYQIEELDFPREEARKTRS